MILANTVTIPLAAFGALAVVGTLFVAALGWWASRHFYPRDQMDEKLTAIEELSDEKIDAIREATAQAVKALGRSIDTVRTNAEVTHALATEARTTATAAKYDSERNSDTLRRLSEETSRHVIEPLNAITQQLRGISDFIAAQTEINRNQNDTMKRVLDHLREHGKPVV